MGCKVSITSSLVFPKIWSEMSWKVSSVLRLSSSSGKAVPCKVSYHVAVKTSVQTLISFVPSIRSRSILESISVYSSTSTSAVRVSEWSFHY